MNKYIIMIAIVVLLAAFAAGRYSVPKVNTKTQSVVKVDDTKHENTNTNTHTVTITNPNGVVQTTTDTSTVTKTDEITKTQDKETATTTDSRKTLNVSLLGNYNYQSPNGLDYGLSVSKEVIGPITAGVFLMKSGSIGLSIGLDF